MFYNCWILTSRSHFLDLSQIIICGVYQVLSMHKDQFLEGKTTIDNKTHPQLL